ncbi:MAG TPA: hypothetical protein VFC00_34260 [Micromonosporaceae bacterium]|nr:hypothetical protein [Micromonosporaceae bacterium]
MTESTVHPLPGTIVVPITAKQPTSDLLRELNVLLESKGPLPLDCTTLTELRLDSVGWPATVAAAAGTTAAVGAAAYAAHLDGNKQPHYYVAIHITAVWE